MLGALFCYSTFMYRKYKKFRQLQAGRRYEYCVAQTLRWDGWEVIENGSKGINDHGIDLIATKDGVRRYIQCKGWRRDWVIHEEVVSHLLGSVAAIEGLANLSNVELYIYSPAKLDEYAEKEATKLNIHLMQMDYPKWHRRWRAYHAHKKWYKDKARS